MWLLLAFIAVPLVEIGLFIQVGGAIGLWWTLLIVLLTAVAGTWLVRSQGLRAMADLRGSMSSMSDPSRPLAHGAMILFSGALLLTPGFFTDAVGFLLLVPGFRDAVMRRVAARIDVRRFDYGPAGQPQSGPRDRVIDGEFHEVDAPERKSGDASGWTRH